MALSETTTTSGPAIPPLLGFTDGAGKVLAILGTFTTMLSVFYDHSFLLALGLGFAEVPTNLADHVRSAVVWLPALLPSLAFYALLDLLFRGITGFQRAPTSRREDYVMYALSALVIAYTFLLVRSNVWIYAMFFFGWPLACIWAIRNPGWRAKLNRAGAVVVVVAAVIVPMIGTGVGALGHMKAHDILAQEMPAWRLTIKAEQGISTNVLALGIRRFSEASVVVLPDRSIQIIRNDQILAASTLGHTGRRTPLGCSWFSWLCTN